MGGLAGHMMHPHDNMNLTVNSFLKLCIKSLEGEMKFTEKLDGFNIHILKHNGELRFARNGSDLLTFGFGAEEIEKRFSNERVRNIFRFGWNEMIADADEYRALLPEFKHAHVTLNVEIICERTNIIPYWYRGIFPHNFHHWVGDENGKLVCADVTPYELDKTFIEYLPQPYDYKEIGDTILANFTKYGLTLDNTLLDYYRMRFLEYISEAYPELKKYPAGLRALFNRFFKVGEQTNLREIRKVLFQQHDIQYILDDAKEIVKFAKTGLDQLVLWIGTMILENVHVRDGINDYAARAELQRDILNTQQDCEFLERWAACGYKIFSIEGVVTEFEGNLYKWTGPFAPINQLISGNR